jgi:hypothetical protein
MAISTDQTGRNVPLEQRYECPTTSASSTRSTCGRSQGRSRCRDCSSRSSCAPPTTASSSSPAFHRVAAARSLDLAEVPVVLREAETEDADRAVENITSCRCRHDVINADRDGMPTSPIAAGGVRCPGAATSA